MTELFVCLCRQQFLRLSPLLHGKNTESELLIIFVPFKKKVLFYFKNRILLIVRCLPSLFHLLVQQFHLPRAALSSVPSLQ